MVAAGPPLVARSAALGAGKGAEPALRFVRIDPLIVRGIGFRGNERVTVTARLPRATRTAQVTASAAGFFRVRLGRVRSYDPCVSTLAIQSLWPPKPSKVRCHIALFIDGVDRIVTCEAG